MPDVLMVCYYYPPLGGIGSQRSRKFARYLPEHGWHPVVLTPARGSYFVDQSLDDGTSSGVEVVRTGFFNLSSVFKRAMMRAKLSANGSNGFDEADINIRPVEGGGVVKALRRAARTWAYIPDAQVGWFPYAVSEGLRALETRDIEAIYSTSAPPTAHLIGYRLKRLTNKPWVADFRDLWTENHYAENPGAFRKRIDQIIESELLDKADLIITVSDAWADALRRLSGGRKRIEVIRNGYDANDFAGIKRGRPEQWTITYVGSFYGAKQDPTPFFKAAQRLIEAGRVRRADVRIKIVGEPEVYVKSIVEAFGLSDVVQFTGFVTHRDALAHQVNSSLLLAILHGDKTDAGHVPGKLYEYLGALRPILALVPSDFEAARIIRSAGAGAVVAATDAEAIEEALLDSYAAYKSGDDASIAERDLSSYERRNGARRLANLLYEVSGAYAG
jgi:glycosyltransferase involved in cell wall biosynthesis